MKTIKFGLDGQEFTVSIAHGNVWLVLEGGVSTPLAMSTDPDGGRYAYIVFGVGTESYEVRIYEDGEVYGAE